MHKAPNQKYVVGIMGGVGPDATGDLYKLIIANTPARTDQEHLRVIIDSNPLPDRTQALLNGGELCSPYLLESAKLLMTAGADFLVCPCNTAHCFLPGSPENINTNRRTEIAAAIREFSQEITIPVVSMIKETAKYIDKRGVRTVGLLSTAGTMSTGIYQEALKRYGIQVVVPSAEGVAKEMEAIYGERGIKAGGEYHRSDENKALLLQTIEDIRQQNGGQGIEGVIMGCTEIPLCLKQSDADHVLINPTEILAQATVDIALGRRRMPGQ